MTGANTGREYRILSREHVQRFIDSLTKEELGELYTSYADFIEYLSEVAATHLDYQAGNYVLHSGEAFMRLYLSGVEPHDIIELPMFASFPRWNPPDDEPATGIKEIVEQQKKSNLWRSLALQIKKILKR